MEPRVIKNRSLKISPGGIVTLPVAARKTLAMSPGVGSRVSIAMEDGAIHLAPCSAQGGTRISPKGQLEFLGEPRELLLRGEARHFWLELRDASNIVVLRPLAPEST